MITRTRNRAVRAVELMRLLETGPHLGPTPGSRLTPEEAQYRTRLWLQTWVIPQVEALVPEYREELARREATQIIVQAKEKQ